MSIRLRVTLATVALAALAVGVADVTTFLLLRQYFNGRANASVHHVAQTAVAAVRGGDTLTLHRFSEADRPVLVEVRSPGGAIVGRLATVDVSQLRLPAGLLTHPGRSQQIGTTTEPRRPAFQVIAVPVGDGRTVVAAVSLKNEVSTLEHLLTLNVLVGGIVLALLAAVAAIVLARSLRPLQRIAATADAIAGGALHARVPQAPRRRPSRQCPNGSPCCGPKPACSGWSRSCSPFRQP